MFEFILIAFISASVLGLYFYFIRNFNFWKNLGVPYVKPTPFFGNLKDCVLQRVNIGKHLKKIYDEHNDEHYVGIFSLDNPSLLVRDPELVKNILVKDFQNFMDHHISVDEKIDPLWATAIFVMKGQRWREIRTSFTPLFTTGKMKTMFYLVDVCGKELAAFLQKATVDGSPVEVIETMAKFSTDVIASCAFGINGNSLKHPDAEFRRRLRTIFDFTVRKGLTAMLQFFAPSLLSLIKLKFVDAATDNFITNTVWNTVEYREKHGVVRNDFVDFIMELRKRGKNESQEDTPSTKIRKKETTFEISDVEIAGQALAFLIGSFETSSTTMGYALYELALHPEIQHRLRAEIMEVLNKHNGELTYYGIQNMSYLDMVVSETLRKYPVLSFLDRKCCSDYELPAPTGNGTITLPAGIGIFIPVLALHHDPMYFPDPEKFDPERFAEENENSRPNYTYIPFGEGPRMCIGMRFGQMLMKAGLCHILSCFEVEPCKETSVPIVYSTKSFLLQANREILLSFKKIQ